MDRSVPDNVGRLDAGIRWVAAVALLALAGWLINNLDPDWAFTILIGGLVISAYLMLSAYIGFDAVYVMLGVSTARRGERYRGPERPGSAATRERVKARD